MGRDEVGAVAEVNAASGATVDKRTLLRGDDLAFAVNERDNLLGHATSLAVLELGLGLEAQHDVASRLVVLVVLVLVERQCDDASDALVGELLLVRDRDFVPLFFGFFDSLGMGFLQRGEHTLDGFFISVEDHGHGEVADFRELGVGLVQVAILEDAYGGLCH